MSILTLVQRACRRIKMVPPSSALGSTDPNVLLLVELAREDASVLAGQFDWPDTLREQSFVTVAAVDQPGALPTDFGRMAFQADDRGDIYDSARRGAVAGPETAGRWRGLTSGWTAITPNWRIFGGALQLAPAPAAGLTYAYTYVTTDLWGTGKTEPETDADEPAIPEDLILLGMVWRWKQVNGFDYAEDMASAGLRFEQMAGTARGSRASLTVGRRRVPWDAVYAWPGVIVP